VATHPEVVQRAQVLFLAQGPDDGGAKLKVGSQARAAVLGADACFEHLLGALDQRIRLDRKCRGGEHGRLVHLTLDQAAHVATAGGTVAGRSQRPRLREQSTEATDERDREHLRRVAGFGTRRCEWRRVGVLVARP